MKDQKPKIWYKRWFVKWPVLLIALLLFLDYIVLPIGMGMYVDFDPKKPSCCKTPNDYGLDFKWVNLVNTDGSKLVGWYIPGKNYKTVILMHGASSSKSNLLDHAKFLSDAGYNTFLLDAHGHGDSGGRNMEYGWNSANDVTTVINWLQKQPELKKNSIGLLGLSMGAEGALSTAASDKRVKAVVAEGASVHAFGDARAIPGEGWASYPIDWLTFKTMDIFSDDPAPIAIPDAMKLIKPRPVLLISSNNKKEQQLNPVYAQIGGKTVTYWNLNDTPHINGLYKHPTEYKKRVLHFFDTSLR